MLKVAKQLFLLQNTYRTNSILYYLKRLPLIGLAFPYTLYSHSAIKAVFAVLSVMFEIGKIFLSKGLYVIIITMAAGYLLQLDNVVLSEADVMLNILLWCTFAGGVSNCFVLEPQKDQNYAIMFMRMNAKKVALTSFFQFLITTVLGMLPFYILVSDMRALGAVNIFAIFVIMVSSKLMGSAGKIYLRAKNKNIKVIKESYKEIAISLLISSIGALFVVLNISISTIVMLIIATVFAVMGAISLKYLLHFSDYLRLYKVMYNQFETLLETKGNSKTALKTVSANYITDDSGVQSNKRGYAMLSDCFMKRHRKLLFSFSRVVVLIEVVVLAIASVVCLISPDVASITNDLVIRAVPLMTYIMYFFNCGERTVKTLFMNCDSEMLTYRFYRQPKAIVEMFTLRLKALVVMDWFQSLPLALGLPLILFVSGGTNNQSEYFMLFLSIMAMSTFFSVHNLVIYYLFQPYNKEVEMKNPIYTIIKSVTYVACFLLMRNNPPFAVFGIAASVFCVLYIVISIPLAYKIAPKTFRLK